MPNSISMAAPRHSASLKNPPSASLVTPSPQKHRYLAHNEECIRHAKGLTEPSFSTRNKRNPGLPKTRVLAKSSPAKSYQSIAQASRLPTTVQVRDTKSQLTTKPPQRLENTALRKRQREESVASSSKLAQLTSPVQTRTSRSRLVPSLPKSEFTFTNSPASLSAGACRLMESLSEETARIKADMIRERDAKNESNVDTTADSIPPRRLQRKAGRYSDVHRREFKKMDSIANHPSILKHKKSFSSASPLRRIASKGRLLDSEQDHGADDGCEARLNPSKRSKRLAGIEVPLTPTIMNTLPGSLRKSSKHASASTTKPVSVLAKSVSSQTLNDHLITSPEQDSQSGSWNKFSDNVKSIWRQSMSMEPLTESTPMLHHGGSPSKVNLNKELPGLPWTPTIKRVEPSIRSRHAIYGSPSRLPAPVLEFEGNKSEHPRGSVSSDTASVIYPDLGAVECGGIHTPRHLTNTHRPVPASAPQIPRDFTFRISQEIKFGDPVATPAPLRIPVKSTLKLQRSDSTIRTVRPSGIPTALQIPGSFDVGDGNSSPEIDINYNEKKRKHVIEMQTGGDTAMLDNAENIDPAQSITYPKLNAILMHSDNSFDESTRPSKRLRLHPSTPVRSKSTASTLSQSKAWSCPSKRFAPFRAGQSCPSPSPVKAHPLSSLRPKLHSFSTKPVARGLSLSRLNMLARPKVRH